MDDLKVRLPHKSYDIFIGSNILKDIREQINNTVNLDNSVKKIAIITDSNVEKIYGSTIVELLSYDNTIGIKLITIRPGEQSKNLKTVERLYNELLDFHITRSDLIIAFGGGVVGDISGFVAATFLRGVPFIQIPTTLLAQVDSSVGGKVAINLPKGKNLVGSFYHPDGVFIDVGLLQTLKDRYFTDGLSEIIKYGCIKDRDLFYQLLRLDELNKNSKDIANIIYKCCDIKRKIVEEDERDIGNRMILNFGHTIGHAIEKAYNYKKYTHGEAVAMGMYHITNKSEAQGLTERGTTKILKKILEKYNLPYELPDVVRDEILDNVKLDKKTKGDTINLILLSKIGEGYIKEINITEVSKFI
ncbi:3-dehydroquinate synthase [Sporosalibacterium faouarense]|uniref:3-dehydroquinate synthase n=1 Tax=Sporosalibacterium faouarense TaxID=516123 RepID=UPI00192C6FEF|nr:3-dehydroquinate synthase [Sporosalibacterium faouarense]